MSFIEIPAPAKINLFLNITGRRADGYHLLQSVFQLIDLSDIVKLRLRNDDQICRINPLPNVKPDDDLVVKAARLLKNTYAIPQGVDIALVKKIPIGAGLGGGSSDAASTLLGLNHLWNLNLSTKELIAIGVQLGADVPFFLFGKNAFVEGIGEVLTEINLVCKSYFLIYPGVSIPTKSIFSSPDLTRNRSRITITDFEEQYASNMQLNNDLQAVATQMYSEVSMALEWLGKQFPQSRPLMTGSGSAVFCEIPSHFSVEKYLSNLPPMWQGFKVNSLLQHSAYNLKTNVNIQEGSRQVG
jgi:4-diphosphocytidyl-2-C-methyl-D-erythritol kinase